MKPVRKKQFFGFTLIELLIVIAIIGILAAAVLVAVNPGKRTRQARDTKRKNDVGSMATALQAYYTTPGMGIYPTGSAMGCNTPVNNGLSTLTSGDLKQVPTGPTGENYCYTSNGGTEAALYATLEEPTSNPGSSNTYLWCWRSSQGSAVETTLLGCTAP